MGLGLALASNGFPSPKLCVLSKTWLNLNDFAEELIDDKKLGTFHSQVPDFFNKPSINVPNIIPIEILNVSEITSIPEKINEDFNETTSQKITSTNEKDTKKN